MARSEDEGTPEIASSMARSPTTSIRNAPSSADVSWLSGFVDRTVAGGEMPIRGLGHWQPSA